MPPRGLVPDPERVRLLAAVKGVEDADTELRAAVIAAHRAGGSVREIAKLIDRSTNTIWRWLQED